MKTADIANIKQSVTTRLNACRVDHSIALVAPAGSGKTTVLVARFLTLVAIGEDINSIVAITYTDNAAENIKQKIIETSHKILLDYASLSQTRREEEFLTLKLIFKKSFAPGKCDDGTTKEIEKVIEDFINSNFSRFKTYVISPLELYSRILNNLTDLNTSTFHGFFHKILTLFPIESGLLPGFGIIGGEESGILKNKIINDYFLNSLGYRNTQDLEGPEKKLIDFFYAANNKFFYNSNGVELILKSVLEKYDLMVYSLGQFAKHSRKNLRHEDILDFTLQDILKRGLIEYIFNLEDEEIKSFKNIKEGIEDFQTLLFKPFNFIQENGNNVKLRGLLEKIKGSIRNKEINKKIAILENGINDFAHAKDNNTRFLLRFYQNLNSAFDGINQVLNYKNPPSLSPEDKTISKNLYNSSSIFFNVLNYINYTGFMVVALRLIREYEREKSSLNVIDFADLEFKMLTLLNSDDFKYSYVEEKLNYKINHLIIDEFQDANRLEFDIVKKMMEENISGEGLKSGRMLKGSLFFVGDPNQSVYGFRSSDYRIFGEAASYFKERSNEAFLFDRIVLKENFRSSKELIDFHNAIFSKAYFDTLGDGSRNVICGKNKIKLDNGISPVTHISYGKDGYEDGAAVASEIENIIKGNHVPPSKIKIISRKHTGKAWDRLKEALTLRDIPFKIYGDSNFYGKREIGLVLSILRFFLNRNDESSFLKIYKILSGNDHGNINSISNAFVEIDRFYDRGFSTPYFLLKKIYLIFGLEKFFSGNEQAWANLKKLLLISGEYVKKTIYEFLAEMEKRGQEGFRESEEEMPDKEDAGGKIRLMTIHGAKGLENDIVFIYDTPLDPQKIKNNDYKFDIIFETKNNLLTSPEFILLNESPPGNPHLPQKDYEIMKESDKKRVKERDKEENEYKRLIYVALTRPRYICYITEKGTGEWFNLLNSENISFESVNSANYNDHSRLETIALRSRKLIENS